MKKNKFSSIDSIISTTKKGGMYILVDDENRENEGDLVISTSFVNPTNINFMAKHARGLICLAMDTDQSRKLGLTLASPINQSRSKTAFTYSIEAKKGVTTGISAYDRAKTIKVASKKNARKNDIVSPGHVFPVIAKDGGVLVRAGHTEASVDISKLAKKNNSAVICEIMANDGKMAKGDDLFASISKDCEALKPDCIFIDEAQFLTKAQVKQLVDVVDELDVPVLAYGLRTDFLGETFEGSHYLLAWADKLSELKTVCHCGKKASFVVRLDENGNAVKNGDQVQIGGNDTYESMCRKHFKELVWD